MKVAIVDNIPPMEINGKEYNSGNIYTFDFSKNEEFDDFINEIYNLGYMRIPLERIKIVKK